LDPQGNASSVLAPEYEGSSCLGGGTAQGTSLEHLSIIPSGPDLSFHERRLAAERDSGQIMRTLAGLIEGLDGRYDLIFIDCPPSLTILPLNALVASHCLLIPIQCEYYAMEGLGQILAVVEELRASGHERPDQLRILLCMHDDALTLNREVAREVQQHFGEQVIPTLIPRDVALAAAPSHNHTILDHDPLSEGALAYLQATKELLHGLG
jgi:chromosome partitioning protein